MTILDIIIAIVVGKIVFEILDSIYYRLRHIYMMKTDSLYRRIFAHENDDMCSCEPGDPSVHGMELKFGKE